VICFVTEVELWRRTGEWRELVARMYVQAEAVALLAI